MMRWDAIVIGGGLAGCAAAIQLAKAGKSVILFEKEKAAHHKVCGEFLSYEAQYLLAELGLDIAALGAVPIERMQLTKGHHTLTASLPFQGMSVSRYALDEALLQHTIRNGVLVERGTPVTSLTKEDDLWKVTVAQDSYLAESVFLATGKHDMRDLPRSAGDQNDYIGFKMYWRLTPQQTQRLEKRVRVILFKGGYAGLEPIEQGMANLCLVVSKPRFMEVGKQWDLLLAVIMQESPELASCLSEAQPCWDQPLAIFGIPYGLVYSEPPDPAKKLYRLGDQMAVIPSFCGDGMAIALYTAAQAVQSALGNNGASYHKLMRQKLLPQIRLASLVSRITASSIGQTVLFSVCRYFPRLLHCIALKTRIRKFRYYNRIEP